MGSWSSKASLSLVRLNYIRIAHTCKLQTHYAFLQKKTRKKKPITTIFLFFWSASVWHSEPQIILITLVKPVCQRKPDFSWSPTTQPLSSWLQSDVFLWCPFLKKKKKKKAHDLCVGHLHLLAVFQYLPAKRSPSLWQNGKRHHIVDKWWANC